MRKVMYILCVLLCVQCREKYEVLLDTPDRGLLVVEGIVNASGSTTIRLSRTTNLNQPMIVPEQSATVTIEGEDLSVQMLEPIDSGRYYSPQAMLNKGTGYRLRITTFDNKEYLSDCRQVLVSQEIDSISYAPENDGVQFYVNSTEDDLSKYYYKWEFEETWRFHAASRAILKFMVEPLSDGTHKVELGYLDSTTFSVADSVYYCWQSRINNNINVGTTAQLLASKIFLPVLFLRRDAWELSDTYSLLVKQYVLSAEGYEFYYKMKKNSESLGSIFDAQPSEISGNIICVSDPSELVVGFVEFTTMTEKRIYVNAADLSGTPYDEDCRVYGGFGALYPYPFANTPEVRAYVYDELKLAPSVPAETIGRGIISFYAEKPECVDCRLRGSNQKPSFWP